MKCDLRVASISDVHLGNPNTTTEEILPNLRRDFNPKVPEFANLDLLFIDGDLFDRLLNFGDEQCIAIKSWFNQLLRDCKDLDIVIRILEGTPSHDWQQTKQLVSENDTSQIGCDVKYVKILDIEYIERFDINVLYVPDEWRPDPDDTWKEVQTLLAERGLDKVDIALMHGTFEHQLPSHIKTHRHLNARYESIVRYFVFVGHIHIHSVEGRIIANGSYDRIAHGEEGPKGFVRVMIRLNGRHEIVFVENVGAKIYRTIDCRGLSLEAAFDKIADAANSVDLLTDSSLRIRANREEPILTAIDVIRKKYPAYNWTIKVDQGNHSFNTVQANLKVTQRTAGITRDNIVELIAKRLENKRTDPVHIQRALLLLSGVIKNGTN
jgi:hypothetical protein